MRKKLLRLLRIAPLALLVAGVAFAQTTGTIIGVVTDASTGKPVAGAVIVARSPNLQGEQTAVTDNAGNYRITLLPPGDYTLAVQLEGFKPAERSDIVVRMDKTIRANLAVVPEAVQMEEQVVRTGTAPAVNVGSAEAGSVVSREFLASVPVARGLEQAAAVAPTAKIDTYGISFAGAQSPENQYIIDGLNTTDPTYGTRAGGRNGPPALRTNFAQELDVKTGNFGAEYGRATGGILNAVLKSGSNEFHGSVFSSFTPSFWIEPDGKAIGPAGQAIAYRTKPSDGTYALDFGVEVGGPILKDKLWFYGGFAPVIQRTAYDRFLRQNVMPDAVTGLCPDGSSPTGDIHGVGGQCVSNSTGDYLQSTIPGTSRTLRTLRTTYQWVGKLTYLINENHSLTVSGFGEPGSRSNIRGGFYAGGGLYTARSNNMAWTDDGQNSVFARYGGKFLDKKLITEAQVGLFTGYNTPVNKTVAGVDQFGTPSIEWVDTINVNNFESVPAGYCLDPAQCPVYGYTNGGLGYIGKYTTARYSGRASVAYLFDALGQHNVKAGIDLERVDYDVTQRYAGGAYYLYTSGVFTAYRGFGNIQDPLVGPGNVPGIEIGDIGAHPITRGAGKNKSQTDSFAYYLQDSWQMGFLPNVTLNYGLRLETQSMENLDFPDATGFKINDNWSPRIQAIWDFTGNGRGKVAGSWGRFYYAMPLDMGNRAFGGEISLRYNLDPAACGFNGTNYGSFNPASVDFPGLATSRSTTCALLSRGGSNNDIRLTGGSLTPADPDLKGVYVDQYGAQVEYEILSDLSLGFEWQARRQGNVIEDMSSNDGGDYYIGNPGKDQNIYLPDGTFAGNSKYVDTFDPATGRTVSIQFPKPERSYDGFTLKATKVYSKSWLASASYTYSVLRGNYPGPYRPEDGQLDPGITAEYDLASLMANKKGYLPGDQSHAIKLYGAYTYNVSSRLGFTASGAYNGISGSPVNALGAHPDYGSSQAFIIPRGQGGRTPWVNTFDLGGSVQYVVKAPYAVNFRVDVFNLFNSQTSTLYDEDYTFDAVQPISGLDCKSRNAAGKSDPGAALRADCPDIAYLKTVDGRPISTNPNWGKPAANNDAYQLPLSMRFSLAVTF